MPEFELSFLVTPTCSQKQQILEIYHGQGWWPRSITDADRVQRVIDGSHCFLAVTSDDQIAGFGRALSDRTGDAYIHDVTVREKFRKRGLGHRIISTLIARLKEDGITWVALVAENGSHAFYEKLDFKRMDHAKPMFRWL